MKTLFYSIIDKLNDKGFISDNTFYYLLDVLPSWLTIPPNNI